MTCRATLVLVPLVLTLAGCASTPDPASMVAAANPQASVCTGVPTCRQVATVDVDGDDRADQVGVGAENIADGGRIVVRVRTASGRTLQTTGRQVRWFGEPYFGAAAIDGRRGFEIVVGDAMGAHYQQFRVITYRDGKLVTLPAPRAAGALSGPSQPTSRWGVDGSYAFSTGVTRSSSAQRGVTLTVRTLERRDSGRGHTGHTTIYRWSRDRWVETSERAVRVSSDRLAYAAGGWHVPGLRRFA